MNSSEPGSIRSDFGAGAVAAATFASAFAAGDGAGGGVTATGAGAAFATAVAAGAFISCSSSATRTTRPSAPTASHLPPLMTSRHRVAERTVRRAELAVRGLARDHPTRVVRVRLRLEGP